MFSEDRLERKEELENNLDGMREGLMNKFGKVTLGCDDDTFQKSIDKLRASRNFDEKGKYAIIGHRYVVKVIDILTDI